VVADVSMSLGNVLAVAGAAREHPFILVFWSAAVHCSDGYRRGSRWSLQKHRWIAHIGLAIVIYVAWEMTYCGAHELTPAIGPKPLMTSIW
jgi:predicted tellurium resistance membrane protein TerC